MATMQPILRGDTYWINVQIDGKRLRKSLGTKDAKMAAEAFTRELAEFYRTRKLKEVPKKTFKEACERWLREKQHKRSISDDQDKIDYFLPKLGTMLLSDIDKKTIAEALPVDVQPSTRNRYRALLRSILRIAADEWEWLQVAPKIKNEPEPEGRVVCLEHKQAEAILAALPAKYRAPTRLAMLTGLRRSNVFGLCWENVNLEKATLIVHADEAKGKRRIVVPLNPQACELLKSLPGERQGRVWPDMDRVWHNTWKAACKRAGVPGFPFHGLRHTWASWHAMAGTDLAVLQQLGGWQSPQMVQRYAHLSPAHLAAAADRVTF